MPSDRFIAIDGLRIHYLDWGTRGRRPLVLLHGIARVAHTFDISRRASRGITTSSRSISAAAPGLLRRCASHNDSHRSQQTTPPQAWDAVWSMTSK